MDSQESQDRDDRSVEQGADDTPLEAIMNRLANARRDLLDLSTRNRLLSTPRHEARAKIIEVIDEKADQIFDHLVTQEKVMTFLPRPTDAPDIASASDAESLEDLSVYSLDTFDDEEDDGPAARHLDTLLQQISEPLASVSADGAYDTKSVYDAAHEHSEGRAVRVLIPPARNAQLCPRPSPALNERNRNVRSMRELGRREWHTHSGYSRRSMVENTMYRYKTIIGRSMRSRTLAGQGVEVQLASKILNTTTLLGMPDSYRVA